jgi:WD40 repeat protein
MIARTRFFVEVFCCLTLANQLSANDLQYFSTGTVNQLQTKPLTLSSHPSTLSAAASESRQHLRTVDMTGKVWQWTLHPPPKPKLLMSLDCEPACATLSGDGQWLAYATPDSSLRVIHIDSRKVAVEEQSDAGNFAALCFAPDNSRFASATASGLIQVWDLANKSVTASFQATPGAIQTIAFCDTGTKIAYAMGNGAVRLHDFDKPTAITKELRAGSTPITALAFANGSNELVIANTSGTVAVYDVNQRKRIVSLPSYPFASWSLAIDPERKRMIAGSWDGSIRVFSTGSWQMIQQLKGHEQSVNWIISGQLGVLTAGLGGRLQFWPSVAGAFVAGGSSMDTLASNGVLRGQGKDQLWVATHSPSGKHLFIAGKNHASTLWDIGKQKRLFSWKGPPTTRCAAISPNAQMLATGGDDHVVRLIAVGSGETQHILQGHRGPLSAVLFVDDGKTLISADDPGKIKFWNVATGKQTDQREGHTQRLYCAAVSPDERWLVTGGGHWLGSDPGELIVWDLANRQAKTSLLGHGGTVWSIKFTTDGKQFAASDNTGAVKIWDTKTLKCKKTLTHDSWIRPLAMSPDGTTLAVGQGDGIIQLWNTTRWEKTIQCVGNAEFTFSLDFSPDSKTLISAGNDGSVRFWEMTPAALK